ncbi:RNA-guided endonuclease IscB [Streptomyces sp. NPDC056230]|uniref:RNA-guided endonuclease IscB n=1 Tax=unclassified Streptomyces TaxID=2593676 RepID=UPI0035E2B8FB
MLPQQQALEFAAAVTPSGGAETGHEPLALRRGTGTEQGRGETSGGRTRRPKRHPSVGSHPEQGAIEGCEVFNEPESICRTAQRVFVLDRHGTPLMPCHPARARQLLAKGRARVTKAVPFTIRITDRAEVDSEVPGVQVRIDPGSEGTGISLTHDRSTGHENCAPFVARSGLFSVELRHRGHQIHANMRRRASLRHRRRTANLRHRKPRFANRRRKVGWLPPSLQHRVDTTVSLVRRLSNLAPISQVHVEETAFDVHAMSADRVLEGLDYQRGTLEGYEVREYLLEKWQRTCAYCGATGVPLEVEHMRAKARGGSDRISNLVLACRPCNLAKGTRSLTDFLADRPESAAQILRQSRSSLRNAAAMNATRWRLRAGLQSLGLPVSGWSGGRTKFNRARSGLPKSHTLDSLCVGEVGEGTRIVNFPGRFLIVACTGRGSYRRTIPDRHGFPRITRTRVKQHFGFTTGDFAIATVPSGKRSGTHSGRIAVRSDGYFNVRTASGLVPAIHHRHFRLLQRGDGYGYTWGTELYPGAHGH